MIQHGLLAFHQQTGGERGAWGGSQASPGTGIRPLGQGGTVPQQRRPQARERAVAAPELLEALSALTIAQHHGRARCGRGLLELQEPRMPRPLRDLEECLQRLLQGGGEGGRQPRGERGLAMGRDRDDARVERRTGWEPNRPEP
jgi:hypothetical protein